MMVLALLLTGAAWAEGDASLDYIKNKGTFILGFDASFPPMGYVDELTGDYVGFDLDLAAEVCNRLGVELVLQPIDWTAKDFELANKNIDCIWNGMTINDDRLAAMEISYPYMENKQVILVKADSGYNTKADLAGKVAAVQAASSGAAALADDAEFSASLSGVVEWPEYATCLMDLEGGMVDCVIIDVTVANYYITGKNLKILDESLAPELYGIGFRKGEAALKDAINAQLVAMDKDGKLAEISTKWFGGDITVIKDYAD